MSEVASEALIARVRKLMAMANHQGSNENEAAVAAAKVQEILATYNLDMAAIGGEATSKERREKTAHGKAAMYKFQRKLMESIAKNNFCMYFLDEQYAESFGKMRTVKRHVLLGSKVNVVVATEMYDYLTDTMDRILPYTGMQKRGKDALAWLEGCADRLTERLSDKRRQMEEESRKRKEEEEVRGRHPGAAPGTSLALVDVFDNENDLNNDALYGYEPGTTTARRKEAEARNMAHAAKLKAKADQARADGFSEYVCRFISYGYSLDEALKFEREKNMPAKVETEAQRRKREVKEERQNRAYNNRYYNSRAYKLSQNPAYREGQRTGSTIGLDDQITEEVKTKLR